MTAYYNEIDPFAAAWLRELIKGGHIAAGEVDTRSIEDVRPDDLRGFDQCHFFAGIGGWSLALRRAGWPDDRPVWTGSCPCQPFSTAGQGAGFDDERHLWPSFHWLIQECRPPVIAGEQVASKDAEPWLDLVQDDLEAMGYAFGAVAFPAAGVGAPHIRDRTYWMAHAERQGIRGQSRSQHSAQAGTGDRQYLHDLGASGDDGRLGHTCSQGLAQCECERGIPCGALGADAWQAAIGTSICSCRLADANGGQFNGLAIVRGFECDGQDAGRAQGSCEPESRRDDGHASPTNGYWRAADWLLCRDGKWRPVEPGTFPLAHGIPARVGRLRGYGNAINAEQAALFVEVMVEELA